MHYLYSKSIDIYIILTLLRLNEFRLPQIRRYNRLDDAHTELQQQLRQIKDDFVVDVNIKKAIRLT